MEKVNDNTNHNNDRAYANDPLTGFAIHNYYKKKQEPSSKKANKSQKLKIIRDHIFLNLLPFLIFGSCFLDLVSWFFYFFIIRTGNQFQDYK